MIQRFAHRIYVTCESKDRSKSQRPVKANDGDGVLGVEVVGDGVGSALGVGGSVIGVGWAHAMRCQRVALGHCFPGPAPSVYFGLLLEYLAQSA